MYPNEKKYMTNWNLYFRNLSLFLSLELEKLTKITDIKLSIVILFHNLKWNKTKTHFLNRKVKKRLKNMISMEKKINKVRN